MSQDMFHLGTFRCCGLVRLPLEEAWEQLGQRPEGRLLVIRRALTFQKCMDLRTYLVLESLHQSRFPNPGFATDEHDLAGPIPGLGPTVQRSPRSRSRPTNGVRPPVMATAKRLGALLACSTRYAAGGSARPRSDCVSKAWHAKYPCTSRYVAALSTIVSGTARSCNRAAILGVSPRANGSACTPVLTALTTTNPV